MVDTSGGTYVDVFYGKILAIYKRLPSRKGEGKFRMVPQGCIHWNDPDASFLCKWFKQALPKDATASADPRKRALVSRGPVRVDGRLSFQLPIACEDGFNWPVQAWDRRILCRAVMTWDKGTLSYLLDLGDERQANAAALAANKGHKVIGVAGTKAREETVVPQSQPSKKQRKQAP
jgi:hypothetical protein